MTTQQAMVMPMRISMTRKRAPITPKLKISAPGSPIVDDESSLPLGVATVAVEILVVDDSLCPLPVQKQHET